MSGSGSFSIGCSAPAAAIYIVENKQQFDDRWILPSKTTRRELAYRPNKRFAGDMESHEWNERTEEGKRFYRGNFHGNEWKILTTLKTDPDWQLLEQPSEQVWRALRDIVWKKYQRKRCPWERVTSIDKILGDEIPQ